MIVKLKPVHCFQNLLKVQRVKQKLIKVGVCLNHPEGGMAAACKLLSFASVILAVSLCCLALCYPWL